MTASRLFEPLGDFLARDYPAPRWIIPGVLPGDSFVTLTGPSEKAKKTLTALTLGLAIAGGRQLDGMQIAQTGKVALIEEEGAAKPLQGRFRAGMKSLGLANPPDDFFISFRAGVKMDSDRWRRRLVNELTAIQPLVVICDAHTYLNTGNLNDESEMSKSLATYRKIQKATSATVILIMHLSKGRGEDEDAQHDAQIRGSDVWNNYRDTHIALRNYTNDNSAPVDMYCYHRDAPSLRGQIRWDITSGVDGDMDYYSMRVLDFERLQPETFLDFLEPDVIYTKSQLRTAFGVGKEQGDALITALIGEGLEPVGKKWRLAT